MRISRRICLVASCAAVTMLGTAPSGAAASKPLDISMERNSTCAAPSNLVLLSACRDQPEASYISETMPKAGPLTVSGVQFQWMGSGLQERDSVDARGQTINVTGAAGFRSVALLVAGHRGTRTGSVELKYTDGSKARRTITAQDWFVPQGKSAIEGIRVQQYGDAGGVLSKDGGVFLQLAKIDQGKTLKSITLPSAGSAVLVFAVSLSAL